MEMLRMIRDMMRDPLAWVVLAGVLSVATLNARHQERAAAAYERCERAGGAITITLDGDRSCTLPARRVP